MKNLIWDLGAVLIDWNPRYLYHKLLSEDETELFLAEICTMDWNEEQDAGRPLAEATSLLCTRYPDQSELIEAYYSRWEEMLSGPIQGTVDILSKCRQEGKYELYALTNWSAETFPIAQERFEFLQWFKGIVVSGEEMTRKPHQKIYDILLERYDLKASECLFIDDNLRNIEAAQALGFQTIHFQGPEHLAERLKALSLL